VTATGFGDGFGALVVRGAVARGGGGGATLADFGAVVREAARAGAVVVRAGVALGMGLAVGLGFAFVVVGVAAATLVVGAAVTAAGADAACVGRWALGAVPSRPNASTALPLPARSAATAAAPTIRFWAPRWALCRAIETSQTVPFASDGATPYARWAMTTTFRVVCSSRPVSR
jgi:hypothetical protein